MVWGPVYLVRDRWRGNAELALKRVRRDRLDANTRQLFQSNEFKTIAGLEHPNILRGFDFGTDLESSDLFFTTEYVEGEGWDKAAEGVDWSTDEGQQAMCATTAGALRGLAFVHAQRIVHGDIKPENILVTKSGEVKLIDFGLARPERASARKKILGTPYYVAPETIIGSTTDRRTDLYSLGIVLYQFAAGVLPFVGGSNLEILRSHVETAPRPPHEVAPKLPRSLSDIILRLLEKRPERRFQSAGEVIEALNAAFSLTHPLEIDATMECYLKRFWAVADPGTQSKLDHAFRGAVLLEDTEDDRLDGEFGPLLASTRQRGRFVYLHGESPELRDGLIRALQCTAQVEGALVARVLCKSGARGFELVRLAQQLAVPTDPLGAKVRATAARMEAELNEGGAPRATLIEALVHEILAFCAERPAVLVIDDVHSASEMTTRFLEVYVEAQSQGRVSSNRALVVATEFQVDEQVSGPFRRLLLRRPFRGAILDLPLHRIDEAELGKLLPQVFSSVKFPRELVRRIHQESDGQLQLVHRIVTFLIENEVLERAVIGWRVSDGYDQLQFPGRVLDELRDSIRSLSEEGLHVGIALSCMNETLVPDVAGRMAGVSGRALQRALKELCAKNMLREGVDSRDRPTFSFLHGSSKRALYAQLDPTNRRSVHLHAGTLLEEHAGESLDEYVEELAFHFLRARDNDRGVRFGISAARRRAERHETLRAIEVYEQVLTLLGSDDTDVGRGVRDEIAELRLQIGDYEGVRKQLRTLQLGESNGAESVPLLLKAARAEIALGDHEEARVQLDKCRNLQGDGVDTEHGAAIVVEMARIELAIGRSADAVSHCRSVFESVSASDDVRLFCTLCTTLARAHADLDDEETAVTYAQHAVRRVEAGHDDRNNPLSHYCRALYYVYRRDFRRAKRHFESCLALWRQANVFEGQADCMFELGRIERSLDNMKSAWRHFKRALAVYERTGGRQRADDARYLLGDVERALGNYEASDELLRSSMQRARETTDRALAQRVLACMARQQIDRGDLARGERYLGRVETRVRSWTGRLPIDLDAAELRADLESRRARYGRALEACSKGLQVARDSGAPDAQARLLLVQAGIRLRLGDVAGVLSANAQVLEIAQRFAMAAIEGRARLIEALLAVEEEDWAAAGRAFAYATEIFTVDGTERDLAELYVGYGLYSLRTSDLEQAYLNIQEASFIAKKLELDFLSTRVHLAKGQLELAVSGLSGKKAESEFRVAFGCSRRQAYAELHWLAARQLEQLTRRSGRLTVARAFSKNAKDARDRVLRELPASCAARYMERSKSRFI